MNDINTTNIAATHFLRLPSVLARTGLSKTTIYRLIGEGDFPHPVKLGPRASAWRAADVEGWAQSRSGAAQ